MNDHVVVPGSRIRRDRDDIADFCADKIVEAAAQFCDPGADSLIGRKLNDLEMHGAAVAMTIRLFERMQDFDEAPLSVGYIAEEDGPELVAAVLLTYRESSRSRRRNLARQLSHHLMRTRVAPALYAAESVICRELDGYQVREKIAERVQHMLTE